MKKVIKKEKTLKTYLHIRVPDELKKAFVKASKENGVNLSAWVLLTLSNAIKTK